MSWGQTSEKDRWQQTVFKNRAEVTKFASGSGSASVPLQATTPVSFTLPGKRTHSLANRVCVSKEPCDSKVSVISFHDVNASDKRIKVLTKLVPSR